MSNGFTFICRWGQGGEPIWRTYPFSTVKEVKIKKSYEGWALDISGTDDRGSDTYYMVFENASYQLNNYINYLRRL